MLLMRSSYLKKYCIFIVIQNKNYQLSLEIISIEMVKELIIRKKKIYSFKTNNLEIKNKICTFKYESSNIIVNLY